MEIVDSYHRLRCDNCLKILSPIADSKPEAKDLAKHAGWILYKGQAWCVECFYKLDAEVRKRMLMEIAEGDA